MKFRLGQTFLGAIDGVKRVFVVGDCVCLVYESEAVCAVVTGRLQVRIQSSDNRLLL